MSAVCHMAQFYSFEGSGCMCYIWIEVIFVSCESCVFLFAVSFDFIIYPHLTFSLAESPLEVDKNREVSEQKLTVYNYLCF